MDSNAPGERPSGKNGNEAIHPDRIAKNTTYLTAALVVQKILSFWYFAFLAKSLGDTSINSYLSAITITTVFGIFIDLGFAPVLIREIAKRKDETSRYLNATITMKLATAVLAYVGIFFYATLFGYDGTVLSLIIVTGLVMVVDSFTLTFYSIFRGHQLLQYEAIGTIINKTVVIAAGVIGLRQGFGLAAVVVALLLGSAVNALFASAFLMKRIAWRPRLSVDGMMLKKLGRIAVPFAIASGLVTLYGYLDQLLLSNPSLIGSGQGKNYLAWYGTAYKLTFALQFLPAAVAAAIFPAMSAFHVENRELLRKTFQRALLYLLYIALPLVAAIIILARQLILTVYTNVFQPSILPLQILSISLFFVFLNYPVGYLLNATDRQTRNTIHIGITLAINFILNLILIPRFTYVGAAIVSAFSSAVLFFLGLSVARRIVSLDGSGILRRVFRILLAATFMSLVLFLLSGKISLLLLIVIGGVVYALALLATRAVTRADVLEIVQFVRRKNAA